MLKNLIKRIKRRIFRKMVRKGDSIIMYGYVMAIISVRGDYVYVKKLRDGKTGTLRLCDIVIKRDGKDFRLSDVRLLDVFKK